MSPSLLVATAVAAAEFDEQTVMSAIERPLTVATPLLVPSQLAAIVSAQGRHGGVPCDVVAAVRQQLSFMRAVVPMRVLCDAAVIFHHDQFDVSLLLDEAASRLAVQWASTTDASELEAPLRVIAEIDAVPAQFEQAVVDAVAQCTDAQLRLLGDVMHQLPATRFPGLCGWAATAGVGNLKRPPNDTVDIAVTSDNVAAWFTQVARTLTPIGELDPAACVTALLLAAKEPTMCETADCLSVRSVLIPHVTRGLPTGRGEASAHYGFLAALVSWHRVAPLSPSEWRDALPAMQRRRPVGAEPSCRIIESAVWHAYLRQARSEA
jgi:hypothetical protein